LRARDDDLITIADRCSLSERRFPMEPCKEEKTPKVRKEGARTERKPRRFRIDRLEERIAPLRGGNCQPPIFGYGGPWTPVFANGNHGKLLGWSGAGGTFYAC